MSDAPVEVTTRYATTVESLTDAWAFVMEHLDSVGPDPRIEISPLWTYGSDDVEDGTRRFSVAVDGMVPLPVNDPETDT